MFFNDMTLSLVNLRNWLNDMTLALVNLRNWLNDMTLGLVNLRNWLSVAQLLPLSVDSEWLLRVWLLAIISDFRWSLMPMTSVLRQQPPRLSLDGILLAPVINHTKRFLICLLWLLSVNSETGLQLRPSSTASENGSQWHSYGPCLATRMKTISENDHKWHKF